MKAFIVSIFLFSISPAHANQSTDFFQACIRGDNLDQVNHIDNYLQIADASTFRGCPKELFFMDDISDEILPLRSVRDGVSGGQYSQRYDDIKPFIACSYENTREYIECSLKDDLITNDILSNQAVRSLEFHQTEWRRRNP